MLIGNAPQGHLTHYLASPWGNNTSNASTEGRKALQPNVRRLIIYNEYPDLTVPGYFAQPEKIVLTTRWEDVLALLEKDYPSCRTGSGLSQRGYSVLVKRSGSTFHSEKQ